MQSAPVSRSTTSASTNPDLLKRVEKEIIKEAKREEANLKHVINDLSHTEKSESKAHKVSNDWFVYRLGIDLVFYRTQSKRKRSSTKLRKTNTRRLKSCRKPNTPTTSLLRTSIVHRMSSMYVTVHLYPHLYISDGRLFFTGNIQELH